MPNCLLFSDELNGLFLSVESPNERLIAFSSFILSLRNNQNTTSHEGTT